MTPLEFVVYGRPRPQGSMKWVRSASGKSVPVRNQALENYRAMVAHEAALAWEGPPTDKAIKLSVWFWFDRPKSHFGTGKFCRRLKPRAPRFMAQNPDRDKLLRAVSDALTGIVYIDDRQVCRGSTSKDWTETGPRTEIEIEVLE